MVHCWQRWCAWQTVCPFNPFEWLALMDILCSLPLKGAVNPAATTYDFVQRQKEICGQGLSRLQNDILALHTCDEQYIIRRWILNQNIGTISNKTLLLLHLPLTLILELANSPRYLLSLFSGTGGPYLYNGLRYQVFPWTMDLRLSHYNRSISELETLGLIMENSTGVGNFWGLYYLNVFVVFTQILLCFLHFIGNLTTFDRGINLGVLRQLTASAAATPTINPYYSSLNEASRTAHFL